MGLFKKKDNDNLLEYIDYALNLKEVELSIKMKSIDKAVDLISKTLALCMLETYKLSDGKLKEVKEDLFYKLNIKPNVNEYAFDFWHKVWTKFFWEKEVLLISLNHHLYVAEDFNVNDSIITEKEYNNIKLISDNGKTLNLYKSFLSHEVIHLKLTNSKTLDFLNNYYNEIGNLILISNNHYIQNNILKYILGIPGTPLPLKDPNTEKEITYEEYKKKLVGSLFSNKDSITLLSKSLSLDKEESDKNVSSEDYRNLTKSWEESVADSFLIPRSIYFGSNNEKSSSEQEYFTYCIKPYLKLLENSLNAIIINKKNYLKGEKIKANINSIKVYNLIDNATALDKLYSDGFSHNDIRKFTDLEQIDEPWANEHRITKNYSEDVSNKSKGGD